MAWRILAIDPVATRRIMTKAQLGAAQYHVSCASDSSEALSLLAREGADAVLLDMELATQDGRSVNAEALCRLLKSDPQTAKLPLIALSDQCGLAALGAGADEVHPRNVPSSVLLACLRARLRDHNDDATAALAALSLPQDNQIAAPRCNIGLLAASLGEAQLWCAELNALDHRATKFHPFDLEATATCLAGAANCHAVALMPGQGQEEAALNMLADIRARSGSNRAGLLLAAQGFDNTIATRGYDMGADSVLCAIAEPPEMAARLMQLAKLRLRREARRAQLTQGLQMAVTDSLTGVANRRFAMQKLSDTAAAHDCFGLLMLDIDHFKQVNDRYGHAAGDAVLKGVAQVLGESLRGSDILGRVGGEEFLIVLPEASAAQAQSTAERLRRAVEQRLFQGGAQAGAPKIPVTLSIGVSHSSAPHPDIEALMHQADQALYDAKSGGRNRVHIAEVA